MKKTVRLRHINNLLGIVVIALALFIFVWPFLGSLSWWAKHQAPIISHKTQTVLAASEAIPSENTLVIPKMDLRQTVYEGPDTRTLSKGVWHIPGTSSPDKNGNTIMAGHRFTYNAVGSGVFYYLDKLAINDNIYMYWQGKRYDYVVTAVNEVPPTDETLVAPTDNPTLTLYTCTPLWTSKHRLVITAKLVEVHS